MSGKQPPESGGGQLERSVRLDYSDTYRENERLDGDLDDQILCLTRDAQRVLTEKAEQLLEARADADRIRQLKEAVRSQQKGEGDGLGLLCQSPPKLSRRASSQLSVGDDSGRPTSEGNASNRSDTAPAQHGPASPRRNSVLNLVASRRASVLRSGGLPEGGGAEDGEGGPGYAGLDSGGEVGEGRKRSVTERRLAMERDRFSSKNLFNVRRQHSALTHLARRDSSPDTLRKNMSAMTLSKEQGRGRPKTSPAAYGYRPGRRGGRGPGYLRPTTSSSSRLVRFADDACAEDAGDTGYWYAAPRRPRSRRELQQLSALQAPPCPHQQAEGGGHGEGWATNAPGNLHHDLLQRLQGGRQQLQARVTAFLRDMDDFNKRGHKAGLDHILGTT